MTDLLDEYAVGEARGQLRRCLACGAASLVVVETIPRTTARDDIGFGALTVVMTCQACDADTQVSLPGGRPVWS